MRGQPLADQAGLRGVLVARGAIVEQHEIAAGLTARLVLLEFETDDVAALRGHFGTQQVGLDHHTRRRRGRSSLLTRDNGRARCRRGQRGRGHRTVGGCGCAGGGRLLGRNGWLIVLEPAIPQHDQGEGENQEEDEAALIHRIRSVSGQGTGSYPPGLKG